MLKPRDYQQKAFEAAIKQNIIVVGKTGTGKTLVAALLMEHMFNTNHDKKIFFSCQTKVLLEQQKQNMIKFLPFCRIEKYTGESSNIDYWTKSQWHIELENHDCLFFTPATLLKALSNGGIKLERDCSLLIYDECHNCLAKSPYNMILKDFYHTIKDEKKKPKIFGLTASPIFVSMSKDYALDKLTSTAEKKSQELKKNMSCKYHFFESEPTKESFELLIEYNNYVDEKLENMIKQDVDRIIKEDAELMANQAEICRYFQGCLYFLQELGIYPLKYFLDNYKPDKYSHMKDDTKNTWKKIRDKYADYIIDKYPENDFSDKVHQLINLLIEIKEKTAKNKPLCGIVFIERKISTAIIETILNYQQALKDVKFKAITGTGDKKQHETVRLFKEGEIHVLLATDVVEEGIDVGNCNFVINFDLFKTLNKYIQRRGRARAEGSYFYSFADPNNEQHSNIVKSMNIEENVSGILKSDLLKPKFNGIESEKYVTPSGATLTPSLSVSILTTYCNKLKSGIQGLVLQPEFKFEVIKIRMLSIFYCKLTLPLNAMINEEFSAQGKSKGETKCMASFQAVKRLHQVGALDDQFHSFKTKVELEDEKDEDDEIFDKEKQTYSKLTPKILQMSLKNVFYLYILKSDLNIDLCFLYPQRLPEMPVIEIKQDGKIYKCKLEYLEKMEILNSLFDKAVNYYSKLMSTIFDLPLEKFSAPSYIILPYSKNGINWNEINCNFQQPIENYLLKTKHTTSLYLPIKIRNEMNIFSKFENPQYKNYKEYYHKKWGFELTDNVEPLIEVYIPKKQIKNYSAPVEESKQKSSKNPLLVPSLCEKICTVKLYRDLSYVPHLTSVVESYLIAAELQDEIGIKVKDPMIMVQSITSKSSFLPYDYERLEFLGDCVLKKIVVEYLFHKYPEANEGYLSMKKDKLINNRFLHKLAKKKKIWNYILGESFNEKNWNLSGWNKTIQREMKSKRIADVVESIIGAYYLNSEEDANKFIIWMGIIEEIDQLSIPELENPPLIEISTIDHKFKNEGLKIEALTHASYKHAKTQCYERLEFLGDAVIDLLVTQHIFKAFPQLSPGRMTDLKQKAVKHESLAFASIHIYRLNKYLLFDESIEVLHQLIEKYSVDHKNEAPKIISDVFEAVCGAIYLDSGNDLDAVWDGLVFWKNFIKKTITPDLVPNNPISELLEYCQKKYPNDECKFVKTPGTTKKVEFFVGNSCIASKETTEDVSYSKLKLDAASVALENLNIVSSKTIKSQL